MITFAGDRAFAKTRFTILVAVFILVAGPGGGLEDEEGGDDEDEGPDERADEGSGQVLHGNVIQTKLGASEHRKYRNIGTD